MFPSIMRFSDRFLNILQGDFKLFLGNFEVIGGGSRCCSGELVVLCVIHYWDLKET
jgi:hypothetical protein